MEINNTDAEGRLVLGDGVSVRGGITVCPWGLAFGIFFTMSSLCMLGRYKFAEMIGQKPSVTSLTCNLVTHSIHYIIEIMS